MKKVGRKAAGKVKLVWSADFAYAMGLIASDGNLSSDGRHVLFVSQDRQQILNFLYALNIKVKIDTIIQRKEKRYFRVQFSDALFYRFLQQIGIGPAKSKTIAKVTIPDEYFFDFLRGLFDGDGYSYSYWDPRWKSSFMFYIGFCSAGPKFISWLQKSIFKRVGVRGHVTKSVRSSCLQLKYAKNDSVKIIEKMYYSKKVICLSRKRLKIKESLGMMSKPQKGKR